MSRKLFALGLLLASLFACAPSHAQFLGYTSPQTVQVNVMVGVSVPTAVVVPNVGQSIHYVSYTGGAGCNFDIRIEASNSGSPGTYFAISVDGTDNSGVTQPSGGIYASGYFPFVRVNLVSFSGCANTISASYSGTSTALGAPLGVFQQAVSNRVLVVKQATVTTVGLSTVNQVISSPTGSTAGTVYVVYSGSATGSTTMTIAAGPDFVHLSTEQVLNTAVSNVGTIQQFTVPPMLANILLFNVSCTGASCGGLIDIYYQFAPEGTAVLPQCDKTGIINTASAGPTQLLAAPATAFTSIHICSIDFSSGTAEAVDFQSGTGSNCATNNAQATGLFHMAVNTPVVRLFPGTGLVVPSASAFCIHLSGANQTDGTYTYSTY